MTRDEAQRLVQAFLKSLGQASEGLNPQGFGGAAIGNAQLYFEYHADKQVLETSALIYKFRDPPKPGVLEGFRAEALYLNDAGELEGFEIDLGNELCSRAGLACAGLGAAGLLTSPTLTTSGPVSVAGIEASGVFTVELFFEGKMPTELSPGATADGPDGHVVAGRRWRGRRRPGRCGSGAGTVAQPWANDPALVNPTPNPDALRAIDTAAPGQLFVNTGEVEDCGANRSR